MGLRVLPKLRLSGEENFHCFMRTENILLTHCSFTDHSDDFSWLEIMLPRMLLGFGHGERLRNFVELIAFLLD
jgi:hypothetical protein